MRVGCDIGSGAVAIDALEIETDPQAVHLTCNSSCLNWQTVSENTKNTQSSNTNERLLHTESGRCTWRIIRILVYGLS